MEGGVRWAQMGDATRVRITPKLIRVADDTTVWTHPYETSVSDLFKVQAEIAYQIAGALQVAVDARERQAVEARPTADTDAYLGYLRGVAPFNKGRPTPQTWPRRGRSWRTPLPATRNSHSRGAGSRA